jgi:hypothetical protein
MSALPAQKSETGLETKLGDQSGGHRLGLVIVTADTHYRFARQSWPGATRQRIRLMI